jgi:hypothetical protein
LTLYWAVAHRMAMMAANHAHEDTSTARDDYIDVFAALRAAGISCIAKPWDSLAGAYAGPELGGPVIMVNSRLDEVTMRHTAGHELGHHCFGHGSRMDEPIDPDVGNLGGPLPDEEKLAEAFAAWFLMPLPAVRAAMRRSGISRPRSPEDVHQIACWLGTSFAGTARHLAHLQLAGQQEAEEWVRSWHNGSGRIRARMCGSRTAPPGRVWVIRPQAHQARLHVLPGDTLMCPGGEFPDPLPPGLTARPEQQLSFEPRPAVTITEAMTQPRELTVTGLGAMTPVTLTLVLPPQRYGIDSAWRVLQHPALPSENQ